MPGAAAKQMNPSSTTDWEQFESLKLNNSFEPYFCPVEINGEKRNALRDTGALLTIICSALYPRLDYTGKEVELVTAFNTHHKLPLARVQISSPHYTGEIIVAVALDLQFPVILGNDIN